MPARKRSANRAPDGTETEITDPSDLTDGDIIGTQQELEASEDPPPQPPAAGSVTHAGATETVTPAGRVRPEWDRPADENPPAPPATERPWDNPAPPDT